MKVFLGCCAGYVGLAGLVSFVVCHKFGSLYADLMPHEAVPGLAGLLVVKGGIFTLGSFLLLATVCWLPIGLMTYKWTGIFLGITVVCFCTLMLLVGARALVSATMPIIQAQQGK